MKYSSKTENQWRCGTWRNSTETVPDDHTILIVFDDKMIIYQRIYLKFSQLMKHLLFYILYKICKHVLTSIDFIASVYELFDTPRIHKFVDLKGISMIRSILWLRLHTCMYNIIEKYYEMLFFPPLIGSMITSTISTANYKDTVYIIFIL